MSPVAETARAHRLERPSTLPRQGGLREHPKHSPRHDIVRHQRLRLFPREPTAYELYRLALRLNRAAHQLPPRFRDTLAADARRTWPDGTAEVRRLGLTPRPHDESIIAECCRVVARRDWPHGERGLLNRAFRAGFRGRRANGNGR